MDVRQMRCFVEVAERLHFGRAAEALGIAQSALSRQIQLLEASLGARLLERNKRAPMRLTDAGGLFLAEARAALAQFERAEAVARKAGRGQLGRLEIGYVASATFSGLLPSVVSAFHRDCPAVAIGLLEMDTAHQVEALEDGRIDVGFIRPRPDYPPGIVALPQLREPILVALRADHPLAAAGGPIPAKALADEDFVVPQAHERAGFGELTLAIGRQGGFVPRLTHHVRDFITVLNFVAVGFGVAAVPASLERVRLPDIVYRPLADPVPHAELVAAFRRSGNAPVVQTFVALLRRQARARAARDFSAASSGTPPAR